MIGLWPDSGKEREGFLTPARIDQPDRRRAYPLLQDRTGRTVQGATTSLPRTPMVLYVQTVSGPEGPIPAPNASTPDRVVLRVDRVRYFS